MGIVAAFDRTVFYNPANRYAVLRMKTADIMIPEEARNPYKYSDHLIRFTAVGYDLPRTDTVKVELEGQWVSGKFGPQLQVERWKEIAPATVDGMGSRSGRAASCHQCNELYEKAVSFPLASALSAALKNHGNQPPACFDHASQKETQSLPPSPGSTDCHYPECRRICLPWHPHRGLSWSRDQPAPTYLRHFRYCSLSPSAGS